MTQKLNDLELNQIDTRLGELIALANRVRVDHPKQREWLDGLVTVLLPHRAAAGSESGRLDRPVVRHPWYVAKHRAA